MSAGAEHQAPVTATGTTTRNVDGQAIAITVFSTVKWWGGVWLPVLFLIARLFPRVLGTLEKLSFIHFARWTLVREIPYNGPPQQQEHLAYPHLFFESNFNGGWEEYIDAFSHVLTSGMNAFWGSSYGFPKPLPTGPFKHYIHENEIEASHFWSAYPDATTTMVLGAIELAERLADFQERTKNVSPGEFADAWSAFLTDVQEFL
jgi:hypothetical protein